MRGPAVALERRERGRQRRDEVQGSRSLLLSCCSCSGSGAALPPHRAQRLLQRGSGLRRHGPARDRGLHRGADLPSVLGRSSSGSSASSESSSAVPGGHGHGEPEREGEGSVEGVAAAAAAAARPRRARDQVQRMPAGDAEGRERRRGVRPELPPAEDEALRVDGVARGPDEELLELADGCLGMGRERRERGRERAEKVEREERGTAAGGEGASERVRSSFSPGPVFFLPSFLLLLLRSSSSPSSPSRCSIR